MKSWVTVRYEDGKLLLKVAAAGLWGKNKSTTTVEIQAPQDDPAYAVIQQECQSLLERYQDILQEDVDLAVARATVYAADRKGA